MKKISSILVFCSLALIVFVSSCKKDEDTIDEIVSKHITENITVNTTWTPEGGEYIIDNDIYVDAVLTILPGTVIKFNTGTSLIFGYYKNATLLAEGTIALPILFTSSSTIPTAGDWGALVFYGNTQSATKLTYCVIEYAGKPGWSIALYSPKINFNNSIIRNGLGNGLDLDATSGFVSFANNTISTPGHVLSMDLLQLPNIGTPNVFSPGANKGILVKYNATFPSAVTFKKQTAAVYVESDLYVDGDITIEPGSTFKFGGDGKFTFGYYETTRVSAIGTSLSHITFTSAASTPASADWYGLTYYNKTSSGTTFSYCDLLYAGKGSNYALVVYNTGGSPFTFTNTTVNATNKAWAQETMQNSSTNNFTWSY